MLIAAVALAAAARAAQGEMVNRIIGERLEEPAHAD